MCERERRKTGNMGSYGKGDTTGGDGRIAVEDKDDVERRVTIEGSKSPGQRLMGRHIHE